MTTFKLSVFNKESYQRGSCCFKGTINITMLTFPLILVFIFSACECSEIVKTYRASFYDSKQFRPVGEATNAQYPIKEFSLLHCSLITQKKGLFAFSLSSDLKQCFSGGHVSMARAEEDGNEPWPNPVFSNTNYGNNNIYRVKIVSKSVLFYRTTPGSAILHHSK